MALPPFEPQQDPRAAGARGRGLRPPSPVSAVRPMSGRRPATVSARVSAAELADWRAKAAAAGVQLSALVREAMARTRTWTAPAAEVERERTKQVARIGNNLNQIARWVNTHKAAIEAVEVIVHLIAIERALRALAPVGSPDADAR